jgi:ABC-2 type transport system permease protein
VISSIIYFFLQKIFKTNSIVLKIVFELITVALSVALVYFAGESYQLKVVNSNSGNLFLFLLIGEIALILPMTAAERLISYFQEIKNQHFYQTLLGLNLSPEKFVLNKVIADLVFPFFRVVCVFLICSLLLNIHFSALSFLCFLSIQILSLLIFICIGMIMNLFYLKYKRGLTLFFSFQSIAAILGGLYFPVEVFPDSIRGLTKILPQTQILKGSRDAFLSQEYGPVSLGILILWLLFFICVFLITNRQLIRSLKQKSLYF